MPNPFEPQLEALLADYAATRTNSKYDDGSDISATEICDLQTRCIAAIQRASGRDSVYYERAAEIEKFTDHLHNRVAGQMGVAKSLLSDIRNGYLKSLEEIIHGDLFADFLEMADHLTDTGYKDAGAVTAGSTLEAHLRQLCVKFSVTTTSSSGPKKADTVNADLVKAGAYSKLDQKSITAWLGLRNDAAHGNYGAYDARQVKLFISNIRDFVTRHPA